MALAGQASGLRLQAISASALLQKLGQASIRASRAARHLVVFDAQLGAQELTPDAAAVFGDGGGGAHRAPGRRRQPAAPFRADPVPSGIQERRQGRRRRHGPDGEPGTGLGGAAIVVEDHGGGGSRALSEV